MSRALCSQPENQHVKFNVDVKVYNEPARLFKLMHTIISSHDGWEEKLAPRILLGLWHPKFLGPAKDILPYCRRSHIGSMPAIARKYFWEHVDAFSMWFPAMTTSDGQRFLAECKAAGKDVMVWTVNDQSEMMEVRLCRGILAVYRLTLGGRTTRRHGWASR
jgi:phosphatidylglycerol phospholipase C